MPATKRSTRREPESDSRERIHRAALALFARYGYEAVSMQQIADEVGLHKSSLFHHYSGKSQLLTEVWSDVMNRLSALVQPLRDPGPPRREVLYEVIDAMVEHSCVDPQAARLLLAVMTAPDDSELRNHCGGAAEAFYSVVISYLKRARQSGVIRRLNIQQAVPNLIGLVLFYPSVAHDLQPLVGDEPFSARARQIRKQELARLFAAMLE
ncbi:MAG TPA: TetR/AcrR family transcriptional regulator [Polyangiales bacterium]|nr:TetR/AcrR family transcriptional regulator [Polyangiales bacterium]